MPINLSTPDQISSAKNLRRQLLNQQLMGDMGNDALIGGGIGASAIGLTYLAKMLANSIRESKTPKTTSEADVLHIRPKTKKDPALAKYSSAAKTAGVMDVLNSAVTGTGAKKVEQLSYGLPLRALALLAGAGGGAMLANKLGVNAKDVSLDNELAQARQEFEAALNDNGEQPEGPNTKLAAAFDRIEKAAGLLEESTISSLDKKAADNLSGGLGQLLGMYALMAMLGGGTAAYYGYNSGVKGHKAKSYELANAARQQRKKKTDPYRPVAVLDQDASMEGNLNY